MIWIFSWIFVFRMMNFHFWAAQKASTTQETHGYERITKNYSNHPERKLKKFIMTIISVGFFIVRNRFVRVVYPYTAFSLSYYLILYLNNLVNKKSKKIKELPVKSQIISNTKRSELKNVASELVERANSSLVLNKKQYELFYLLFKLW